MFFTSPYLSKFRFLVTFFSFFITFSISTTASAVEEVIAAEGWEFGDTLSGGSGSWASNWTVSGGGGYLIFSSEEPYEGTQHNRLTKTIALERTVDLTSISQTPYLEFAYKGKKMAGEAYVDIWDGAWQRVHYWTDNDIVDFTWYTKRIDLSAYNWQRQDFKIRLGYNGNKRDFVYFDDIKFLSDAAPQPIVVTLQSPADSSTTASLSPTLSWSSNQAADLFHLEIDDDQDFSSPLVSDANITGPSYQTAMLSEGITYYWRVRAFANDTWYDWSLSWNFTTPFASLNQVLVQAEDFISSIDNTPGNNDLVYRTDTDTDINFDHSDIDGTTLFHGITSEGKADIRVQNIETGEELVYEVNIPVSDTWNITFNGILNFDLYIDGNLVAQNQGVPLSFNITDYFSNQNMLVPNIALSQGTHTMRIVANNGVHDYNGMQLDFILFESTTNPPAPLANNTKPYDDSAPPAAPAGYVSPVSQFGQLYVDGQHLKSSITGETTQLRFAALHGQKWFPVVKNNTIFNLAYNENVHGIRLPIYAEWGTYDDPDNQAYLKQNTLEIIQDCIDAGIYVELSFHVHASDWQIGGTAYQLEQEFFQWLMAQPIIQAQPVNVIYGVVNEIVSGTWQQARPYIQDMVDIIRLTDPDNIIVSGTPYYSQRPDDVIGAEIIDDNIMYTFHMYTASHQFTITDNLIAAYDAGLALWANEISPGHYDWQIGGYNFGNFDALLEILESRGIPWTNWQWSQKGEALSAFKEEAHYAGPWAPSDFTDGGLYMREKYAAPIRELGADEKMDVLTLSSTCQSQGPKNYVVISGAIYGESALPAEGVSVSYTVSGSDNDSGSVVSDSQGNFTLQTAKINGPITINFSVDSLSGSGYLDDDALFSTSRTLSQSCN